MVEQMNRQVIEGQLFLQYPPPAHGRYLSNTQVIDNGPGSTRQARDPSTHGVKGEQLGVRKSCIPIVRRERGEKTSAIFTKVLSLSEVYLECPVVDADIVAVWLCTRQARATEKSTDNTPC